MLFRPTRPTVGAHVRSSRRRTAAAWLAHGLLAAVAYVPLVRTAPGVVGADTKAYLYLDPTRLLSQAASMWNPDVFMGTVTHENIGYLLPMGPWFAFWHVVGLPTWLAQRLWTGSLLFLAGAGVLFMLRTIGMTTSSATGLGAIVGALAYMLSPYVMQYEARESVLLLPWVGLPWMVGLVARALRQGGWRYPALFALVVALVGSTNAPSLLLVGVGPLLWVLWELATRRVGVMRAVTTVVKIGVLGAGVSLWWLSGLVIEAAYLNNILRYTESIPTVTRTTVASETLRGLGYWFFYGVDKLGLYLPMSAAYMTSLWLIVVSFAVPAAGFLAAFVVRWRNRAYFVALVLVGMVLAVAAHPLSNPTPVGRLIRSGAVGSNIGLGLRSTNRATPLVILGTAVLLGAAVAALARRWRAAGAVTAVAAAGLVAADVPALWTGQFVASNLSRPEQVPSYWSQAAGYLDRQPGAASTRVLTEPGIDFAAYRWGTTLDSVLPGLMTRPEVEREVVPYGSAGAANLLTALDEEVQSGALDPSALAPMARLMSAGDVVVQSDLQYERYNTPRPRAFWQVLTPPPAGLGAPKGFGPPSATAGPATKYPLIDETELGLPHNAAYPPPVAVFPVAGARPILRTEGASTPMLVDGDGSGLVAAAGSGLLDGQATVLYAPSYAGDPSGLQRELAAGADLVVTDSNRRRAEQVGTVRENFGSTETAGEQPLVADTRDVRTSIFPGQAGDDARTVAEQLGVASVRASGYGNPLTYAPEDRADRAMDGDLRTAWAAGAFDNPVGQYLRVTLTHQITADHVNLVQPLYGPRNRWITRVTLRFDGRDPVTVALGSLSRTSSGQTVSFGARSFTTLQITVDATNIGRRASYNGMSGVGFAEVRIPHQQVDEVLRMPADLVTAAGAKSAGHRLTFVMTRDRTAPVPPRTDPETDIARFFTVPTPRAFSVSGTAALSSLVPDDVVDRLLGTTTPGVVAYSSGRLPGSLASRASATLDGNLATAWSPGLGPQDGNWLEYDLTRPLSFDHMALTLVTDGRHSVARTVTVTAGGESRTVDIPALPDLAPQWATQTVDLSFAPLKGNAVRVTFDSVRPVSDVDYYSDTRVELPIGVAEVSIPGMPHAAAPPVQIPSTCRSDLLTIDGRPVPVSLSGSYTTAQSLGALSVRQCGPAANGVSLGAGPHELQTEPGYTPNVDVDVNSLVLDSAPSGGADPTTPSGRVAAARSGTAPILRVVSTSATSAKVVVRHPTGPFWMVLGESTNSGWHATTQGGADLGPPHLVDGYANGWLVTPAAIAKGAAAHDVVINLEWTPQRDVWAALIVSATVLVTCLVLALWPRRLRRRAGESDNELPALASPLSSGGHRPGWRALVVAPLVAGGVAGAVFLPVAGIPVAVLTLAALLWRHGRLFVTAGCIGLAVAVDWIVTRSQAHNHFVAEFGWPAHFETAGRVAWLAVVLLVADAIVQVVRDPAPWRAAGSEATAGDPDTAAASPPVRRGRHFRRR
ncbi:MAG TPA: alpha-(1-_3)-arabinofuranosyltransferase family protein [Acidimicrobiales bacterium]|nr:alpha-(1->3)-arabinofuranosyltransferase family protein [Acidimicrobiales bacterium]